MRSFLTGLTVVIFTAAATMAYGAIALDALEIQQTGQCAQCSLLNAR